ncbi:MAG: crotonase/enoyl-CoA hydratase family protein [Nevskiales bacterium]
MKNRVRLEVRDEIAYVALARAEKYNGLDLDMLDGLVEAAKRISKDRSIRAVILSGEGKVFCAGLDFGSVTKQPARMMRAFAKFGLKHTNLFQEAAWAWRKLTVPVIAVTHGRCYGGGLQIALAADFRFSTPDCVFSIMEVKWGLIPDMTGTVSLRELLPMDMAKELSMTGREFDGTEAKSLNLVTGLNAEPMAAAQALAEQIKTRSPDAVAAAKALFEKTWQAGEGEAFAVESKFQFKLMRGKNQREAMKANFEKRAPAFKKRQYDF